MFPTCSNRPLAGRKARSRGYQAPQRSRRQPARGNGQPPETLTRHQLISAPSGPSRGPTCQLAQPGSPVSAAETTSQRWPPGSATIASRTSRARRSRADRRRRRRAGRGDCAEAARRGCAASSATPGDPRLVRIEQRRGRGRLGRGCRRRALPRAGRSGGAARVGRPPSSASSQESSSSSSSASPARSSSGVSGSAWQVAVGSVGKADRDQGCDRDVAGVDPGHAGGRDRLGGDPLDLGRAAGAVGDEAAAPVAGDDQPLVLEPRVDRAHGVDVDLGPARPSSARSASARPAARRPAAISARSRQPSWTPTGSSSAVSAAERGGRRLCHLTSYTSRCLAVPVKWHSRAVASLAA